MLNHSNATKPICASGCLKNSIKNRVEPYKIKNEAETIPLLDVLALIIASTPNRTMPSKKLSYN
jgi:hypothetical protein